MSFHHSETIVVLDFETTGMDPEQGDRVIEVGAILLRGNEIVERFQSLIHPGFLVTREIETITGITNAMLVDAPPADQVMTDFNKFIDTHPLVAHNASFDRKFLEAELRLLGKTRPLNFGCSLQVARRIYPDVINYKLETLARYKSLPVNGQFHRALADAEIAAALWIRLMDDIKATYGFADVDFELMKNIARQSREQVNAFLQKEAEEARRNPTGMTGSLF